MECWNPAVIASLIYPVMELWNSGVRGRWNHHVMEHRYSRVMGCWTTALLEDKNPSHMKCWNRTVKQHWNEWLKTNIHVMTEPQNAWSENNGITVYAVPRHCSELSRECWNLIVQEYVASIILERRNLTELECWIPTLEDCLSPLIWKAGTTEWWNTGISFNRTLKM